MVNTEGIPEIFSETNLSGFLEEPQEEVIPGVISEGRFPLEIREESPKITEEIAEVIPEEIP